MTDARPRAAHPKPQPAQHRPEEAVILHAIPAPPTPHNLPVQIARVERDGPMRRVMQRQILERHVRQLILLQLDQELELPPLDDIIIEGEDGRDRGGEVDAVEISPKLGFGVSWAGCGSGHFLPGLTSVLKMLLFGESFFLRFSCWGGGKGVLYI